MVRALYRLRHRLLCLLVVLLPLERLLDVNRVFYLDWLNHVWIVSYYSAFFRGHWALPDVVHSTQVVGLAHPILYGHVFYSIGGLLGSLLGPDLSIRIIVFAVTGGQFYLVFRLVESYSANRTFSTVMATLVTWSVYPLTNLYNRGAMTEFVAVCLLNMSICSLLLSPRRAEARSRTLPILAASLFFTLAALTHPITGVIGGVVLCLLWGTVIACHRERRHLIQASLGGAVLSLVVLSPWLYALSRFGGDVPVNKTTPLITYAFDTFPGRIAPFPFDGRSLIAGSRTDTPHLDAQINMAIVAVLVALWLAFTYARTPDPNDRSPALPFFNPRVPSSVFTRVLAIVAGVGFVYGFAISLGWFPDVVPVLVARAQFGYRLITYQNLCLLLLALAATQHYAGLVCRRDVIIAGMAVAVSLSFTGVVLKLTHANAVRGDGGPWHTRAELVTLPATFYALGDYNVVRDVSESPPLDNALTMTFAPSAGTDFARLTPIALHAERDSVVKSNVYAFPWNSILVDSLEVPKHYYQATYPFGGAVSLTSFVLPAGSHTVEYRFTPDPAWKILRRISFASLALWLLGLCGARLLTRPSGRQR